MFVRVKTTPNSPRQSVQIVQSVRIGDKVKQKIVRYVGIAMVANSSSQSETPFHAITWRIAWLRFIAAMLSWVAVGMGFIWSLFHQNKLTWHDIFSQTRLVVISKDCDNN